MGYFDLVFTLPHELNRLILAHKKIVLGLVFKAVSETLLEFGQSRLGGTLGIIAVLHTWDQTLKDVCDGGDTTGTSAARVAGAMITAFLRVT